MDESTRKRLEVLERKVAILRGERDPGLSCDGTADSSCCGGRVKDFDEDGDKWSWGTCPTCRGNGRVYPTM